MVLGNMINKLNEGTKKRGHISYRDSKVTRILQPALGGNAKTSIICTVAPEEVHIKETKGTLQFASRAKRITNCVQVNEALPVLLSERRFIVKFANCSKITSMGSGVSEANSESTSICNSPEQRPSCHKSGHRAAGFDFFLGAGGSSSEVGYREGDESSTLDSESESDDSSIVNSLSMQSNMRS